MKLTLSELSPKEMQLILEILNADTTSDSKLAKLKKLQGKCDAFMRRTKRIVVGSVQAFQSQAANVSASKKKEILANRLRAKWRDAKAPLRQVIADKRDEPGFYCWLPPILLPAKEPIVLIYRLRDLVYWFLARAVANRQHLLFVRCQHCEKFGLRKRGRQDTKYCSSACQLNANLDQKAKKYTDPFPRKVKEQLRLEQLNRRPKTRGGLPGPLAMEYLKLDYGAKSRKRRPSNSD